MGDSLEGARLVVGVMERCVHSEVTKHGGVATIG